MSRRPATFTQADVARALRAIKQADVKMSVEISPDGTIRIVPAQHLPGGAIEQRKEIVL